LAHPLDEQEDPQGGDRGVGPSVIDIDPSRDDAWDRYVEGHPDGTPYHLAAWSSNLERTYRYRPLHLALRGADGELAGVLPLLTRRGLLSGRRIRSLPAVPIGGPLADDAAGAAALLRAACELSRERQCELAVDSMAGGLESLVPGLGTFPAPPTWIVELPDASVDAWLKERSRNLRRSIRKALDGPLVVRDDGGLDDLKAFHRFYAAAMRAKGTFPRPLAQMTRDCEALQQPGIFRLFVIEHEGRAGGGLLCHAFKDSLALMIIGSDESLPQKLRPHHLLYMRAIEWAAEQGLGKIDFGWAPRGHSNAEFKESWGASPHERFGYSYPDSGGGSAIDAPRPADHAALKALWDRVPLPVVSLAGALAYRYL
jgi:hypothetical protein